MAEFEELRLTVTLANEASVGVTKLQQQMKELSTGPSARHVEKYKRESSLVRELARGLGVHAVKAGSGFEALAARVGFAGGLVATYVLALIYATKKLADASESIDKTGQEARQIGTDYPHLKNISEQLYKSVAINEDKAKEIVKATLALQVEARKENSDVITRLGRTTREPELARELQAALVRAVTVEEMINAELDYLQKLDEAERKRGDATDEQDLEQRQAAQRRVAFEQAGIATALHGAEKLNNITAERQKFLAELNTNATTFARDWRTVWRNVSDLRQLLVSDILGDPLIIGLLTGAKVLVDWIYKTMEEAEKLLRGKTFWDIDPKITEFFRRMGQVHGEPGAEWSGAPQPLLGSSYERPQAPNVVERGEENVDDNTRELRRLNEQMYKMLNPPAGQAGVGSSAAAADAGAAPGLTDQTGPGSTPSIATPPPNSTPPAPASLPPPPSGPSAPPPSGVLPAPGLFEHTPMGTAPPGGGGGGDDVPLPRPLLATVGTSQAMPDEGPQVPLPRERPSTYIQPERIMRSNETVAAMNWQRLHDALIRNQTDAAKWSFSERDVFPEKKEWSEREYLQGPGMHPFGQSRYSNLKEEEKEMEENLKKPLVFPEVHGFGWVPPGLPPGSRFNPRTGAPLGGAISERRMDDARATIDGSASARSSQSVDTSAHMYIEVPSDQSTLSPGQSLFQTPRPGRSIQMQPTSVGPPEALEL